MKQQKALKHKRIKAFFVPEAGIEPALPKEQDFESSASTSSATRASRLFRHLTYQISGGKGIIFILPTNRI